MHAVNVIGLMDYIDEVVTVLGESGVFHPDEVSNFYHDVNGFTHLQSNTSYSEALANLQSALSLTRREFPLTDAGDYNPSSGELESYAAAAVREIESLVREKNASAEQLDAAKHSLSVAEHFAGLSPEVQEALKMTYMQARFGRLPKDSLEKLESFSDTDYADFAVCTQDDSYCWGVYFAPQDKVAQADRIFKGLSFEPIELGGEYVTPNEIIERYRSDLPHLEQRARVAQERLDRWLDENTEQLTRNLSKLEELNLYSGIRGKALQHGSSFIIVGWIPSEKKKKLQKRLKKIPSVDLDFSDAKNEIDKNPPVKLKNCFFAKPFEFYTEMYGVPKYNEIDPTLFVAITYVLIFGVMFADLGQGLCLSIAGILMWKLKGMAVGKILFPCGISSMIFGTIFGSFFGFEHTLDPMFRLFGFHEKPIEVMASQNTNTIIVSAIGVGVVLLLLAMFLNVYTSLRQKNYGRALFGTSGVAGILFYGATVFGLVAEMFLGVHVLSLPYILGLIVLPFIVIFFAEPLGKLVSGDPDWQPESWGGYIVENIFESIEVLLSYVTNTMSFLRVGAFVLVHAGMMMVVFVLAETAGGVGYWVIVVIGNALVMVLEALLVAIQVLRLEYYEMFSRFYTGEGRPFEPVTIS